MNLPFLLLGGGVSLILVDELDLSYYDKIVKMEESL
jgi:hypothetical protein